MKYPFAWISCALAMSACGGVDSDFSKAVSMSIFDSSNGELHTMHLTALELDAWPTNYSWDCEGGGSIDMVTTYVGAQTLENIDGLFHTLTDCVVDGRTLNGSMNYLDFQFVDCGGASGVAFNIEAALDITGAVVGTCAMDAREDCGTASGMACGHEI